MTLKALSPKGRQNRSSHFRVWGSVFIFSILVQVIIANAETSPVIVTLFIPVYLLAIWWIIASTIKRLHDSGLAWYWVFMGIIPLANIMLLGVLFFRAGDKGANKYGDPIISEGVKA